ncbi:permease prefix domain 1-containing protein [Halobacillus naozhouensis]|uniref:Permease prefix domain 1-containing protein n=1 Tax=Halobacillus naozhouensis TaxID=554880 RepID=A0ABY8J443_9BACI|nr:permease prefix domain 1-containing protein [Halobacillus naozhouensis]WFT76369.1 permease prefix domain 1-containing protein [Halobacillus naozhouensis]
MNRMEKHVNRILDQMQSPPDEREDIKEELMAHLESSKNDYVNQGNSEKKAEMQALNDFGDPNLIGHGLQESLYPHQRSLLYVIGIATLLFGVFFYISLTFVVGEVEPIWLLIQMIIGSAVTLSAINIAFMGRHYWSLNVLVLITAMWNGFNGMIVEQVPGRQAILFWSYLVIVVLLCILFVIRNSYYSSTQTTTTKKSRSILKISYVVNIIFGVMICAAALFFTYGFLIFGGFGWTLLFPLSSIIAWLIFFKFQMKLIQDRPLTAIAVGFGFLVFVSVSPFAIAAAM